MAKTDRSLLLSWAVLVALTLISFESAWGLAWLRNPAAAIALVIGVALLKVRIVILNFMEVKAAPWILRGPLEAWVVLIAGGILGLWYSAGV
jgi:heme/copper-type cytochrome/quinol oxidase subunit 4